GQQWFLRAARRYGLEQLLACVYSPPTWLTRNGHAHADKGLDGCNLKPGAESDFARFLGDVLQHFAAEGLPLAYLSPVNEPAWDWEGGQEGCSYDNADLARLVRALHAELRRRGLKTEIDIPESGDWPALLDDAEFRAWAHPKDPNAGYRGGLNRLGRGKYREYLKDFLGDPELRGVVGNKLSAHSYWTDKNQYQLQDLRTRVRANADRVSPGARLWQSEYCVMEHGRDLGMDTALRVARVIHYDLVAAQVSAWHWWLAISPADYKDGLIYTDYKRTGEQNILPSKTLWVLGQYSRLIRPGFRRVELTPSEDGELLASAYAGPDAKLVVVLTNAGTDARSVRLTVDRRLGALTPYLTSADEDLARQPDVAPGAPVAVPARAVMTLVTQG
ncbi:MAG: hypothetical protein HYU66_15495, partial [Armatimonadetes bacterium]|nr:hypothetical protein [Armatimonadota bacterium]